MTFFDIWQKLLAVSWGRRKFKGAPTVFPGVFLAREAHQVTSRKWLFKNALVCRCEFWAFCCRATLRQYLILNIHVCPSATSSLTPDLKLRFIDAEGKCTTHIELIYIDYIYRGRWRLDLTQCNVHYCEAFCMQLSARQDYLRWVRYFWWTWLLPIDAVTNDHGAFHFCLKKMVYLCTRWEKYVNHVWKKRIVLKIGPIQIIFM
jgi:hypothetical protein